MFLLDMFRKKRKFFAIINNKKYYTIESIIEAIENENKTRKENRSQTKTET